MSQLLVPKLSLFDKRWWDEAVDWNRHLRHVYTLVHYIEKNITIIIELYAYMQVVITLSCLIVTHGNQKQNKCTLGSSIGILGSTLS